MMSKWDDRYLQLAETVAGWSKDPSLQVGAVIVRADNTVASLGFNGFPRGCSDDVSLYEDREEKYARVVHAELNAILNAHERLDGCTIYLTHPPCAACAAALIQAGVVETVTRKPSQELILRWGPSLERAMRLLSEAKVHYVEVETELRSEGTVDSEVQT
jgi:dCMP deaminase